MKSVKHLLRSISVWNAECALTQIHTAKNIDSFRWTSRVERMYVCIRSIIYSNTKSLWVLTYKMYSVCTLGLSAHLYHKKTERANTISNSVLQNDDVWQIERIRVTMLQHVKFELEASLKLTKKAQHTTRNDGGVIQNGSLSTEIETRIKRIHSNEQHVVYILMMTLYVLWVYSQVYYALLLLCIDKTLCRVLRRRRRLRLFEKYLHAKAALFHLVCSFYLNCAETASKTVGFCQ